MTYTINERVEWRAPHGWIQAHVVKAHADGIAIRLPGNDLLIVAQPRNLRRSRLGVVA